MKEKITISAKIAILAAMVSVVFGFWSGYISLKTYKTQYRPYVGIARIDVVKNTEEIDAKIILVNTGMVPANNMKFEFSQFENGVKHFEAKNDMQGSSTLMPSPTYQSYRFSASRSIEEKEWTISFLLQYDGIETKGYKTYITAKYNKENNVFDITDGYAK